MCTSEGPAAPASGLDEIPTFEELAADPGIAALLDFEPVPRKINMPGGWTAAVQREFIARLAHHGSPAQACREVDKHRSGANKLYLSPHGESFRAAWDAAVDLAYRRRSGFVAQATATTAHLVPPSIEQRCKRTSEPQPAAPAEGQLLNEYGEPEDADSFAQRGDEAMDHISGKMRNARRLFLRDIAPEPAKRAAFEILTGFTIDWDKAERLEPQADEPWRKPRMRETDMLLTAEDGWMGDFLHGPDRKAELLAEINAWRAERGLCAVVWKGEGEDGGDLEEEEE